MSRINFQISGKYETISKVWVHLQDVKTSHADIYKIQVPKSILRSIFDPYDSKSETITWSVFIQTQIEDLGTFIVEGYLQSMTKINGESKSPFYWVLATIDKIEETDEGVELIGKVLPFKNIG